MRFLVPGGLYGRCPCEPSVTLSPSYYLSSRMPKPMPAGTHAAVEQRVEFEHTLQKFHPELPPVLSTPQMIGWMEWACFLAAEPFCEGDETTVGTAIHVEHLAATGVGHLVKAEAVLEQFDGKFYIFRV